MEEKLDSLLCCGLQGYIQPVKDACTFCCEFWHGEEKQEEEEEEGSWQIEMQSYQITEKHGQKRVEI